MFTKELTEIVLKKNKLTQFRQNLIEDELKIPNNVLYYKNPISKDIIFDNIKPECRIYCFLKKYEPVIFENEEELIDYVKKTDEIWKNVCVIEYVGDFAGRENVIKITYLSGEYVLCTATKDEIHFGIFHDVFNYYETVNSIEPVWQTDHLGLKSIYNFYEEKGLINEKTNPYKKLLRLIKNLNSIK